MLSSSAGLLACLAVVLDCCTSGSRVLYFCPQWHSIEVDLKLRFMKISYHFCCLFSFLLLILLVCYKYSEKEDYTVWTGRILMPLQQNLYMPIPMGVSEHMKAIYEEEVYTYKGIVYEAVLCVLRQQFRRALHRRQYYVRMPNSLLMATIN